MPSPDGLGTQLKEACRLTHAVWAASAERQGGHWLIQAGHGLTRAKQTALVKFLGQESVDAWLAGAWDAREGRSASLPTLAKLDAARLYAFPTPNVAQVILVGARQLSATHQRLWKLVASLLQDAGPEIAEESFVPDLQAELSYDTPRAYHRILTSFEHLVKPQGAWFAIRRGDTFELAAELGAGNSVGRELSLESSNLLRRLHRTRSEIAVERGELEWAEIPGPAPAARGRVWICFPLIVGQRLIGAIALWRAAQFTAEEWREMQGLARRVSPAVEVVVTFFELSNHLRRLAMLNDFALTISSAQNLDQITRRVFALLSRSFKTELISLYLPSADGRLMREYTNREGKFAAQNMALFKHPALPFLKAGRLLSLTDAGPADARPFYAGARSALVVPLKYRGQTIGLLSIESQRPAAFNQYDENLLGVVATHLAGLVEYGRLREEAEARARNLGLIHEVVQQIIGLSDKSEIAQITADLLAQYFSYELAGVLLIGEIQRPLILGLGGSRAESVRNLVGTESWMLQSGITGRVFYTGETILVNDTSQDKTYKTQRGWDAGSQMCVALEDGDRVFGIIDVESSHPNTFTNNDLIAMESLAGVLAAVASSADQYQRQQETVRQLREAQVELRARMTAQQEAESRLLQAAKLAAVGEMAAGIAHELNNPLTTVTGFTELILDEIPAGVTYRSDMELVLQEALRARDVVRRLLDFARQGDRARSRSDLNEIIEDVLALTRHLIHTSGVQLNAEFGGDLPWVSVDSNQMKQVFLNLVHNALQAMPSGGALDIRTSQALRNGRPWLRASVKDSGVGIDPKFRDRIFEPFFTTKGEAGGTGLGLSVSYGIVTDHGGTIEVDSRPGEGSTFAVWLPV